MVTVNLSRLVGVHVCMVTVYLSGLGTVLARIACGRPCVGTVNLNIFFPTVNLNIFFPTVNLNIFLPTVNLNTF